MEIDEIKRMTELANRRKHAEILTRPIFNDFKELNSDNPTVIILAQGQAFLEELINDGPIEEPIEERIDLVYKNTIEFYKQKGLENPEKWLNYYRRFSNGAFDFWVYYGDIYPTYNGEKQIIRHIYAYFIEPKFKDFYQLSLTAGPFAYPPQIIKEGCMDLENDPLSKELDRMMTVLMGALRYKEVQKEETVKEKVEKELNNKPLPAFFMNMTQQLLDQADRLAKEYAGPNYDISVLQKIVCSKYQCEKIIREIKAKKITCENEAYFLEDYWTGSGSSKTAFGTKTFEMTRALRDILTAMAPQSGVHKMANVKVVKQTEPEKKEDINKPNGSQFFEL